MVAHLTGTQVAISARQALSEIPPSFDQLPIPP
jgi:hypothetical protein